MAKKTELNKAIDAAQECAHSKDFLNCQRCIQSFANDHSCILSENVRVESIKTLERWLRAVELIVREREMLDYSSDTMWLPLGSRRSFRPVNLDEFIGWARKQIADLNFYDFTRSIEP
jgi:hypothetical protein